MKVLVIQPKIGMGDMIIYLPYIHAISKNYKNSISILVKNNSRAKELLADDEHIKQILLLDRTKDKLGSHDGIKGFFQLAKEIKTKNSSKKKRLPKYYEIDLNEGNIIDFRKEYKNVTGFGWNNLNVKTGSNMEGYFSTVLFKVKGENCQTKSSITLEIEKYYKYLLIPIELTLILNKDQKENIILNNTNQFVFKFNCKLNDINTIDIKVKNPQSLFDLKKGLNRVKNSIILNSISING